METLTTFLMFEGNAEEAMNFYTALFPGSEITDIKRYEAGQGPEGKVMKASFRLNDQTFMCIDSSVKHQFGFTPAISIFVTSDSPQRVDELFGKLSENGSVLMPLNTYPFSKRFAWVTDRFGVSWQLSCR